MNQFSRTASLFGEDNYNKIIESRVAVVGIGGVGSYAVEALARTGIGNLLIIDDDKVETTNINRQIWALNSTVGKYKVDVARERLLDINSELKIIASNRRLTTESINDLIPKNTDFVIDAIDSIIDKVALVEFCLRKSIPVISCMGAARRKDPTQIKVGNINGSVSGPLIKRFRKELRKKDVILDFPIVYSEEKAIDVQKGEPLPSCCFTTGAVGLTAASYVCKFISSMDV
ncbi:tRNA threonylcarbamoyladenosine dehydratase [bacterium]|nr:tRNA threonylcarbamoyladenosine dehydratase [bacterium]